MGNRTIEISEGQKILALDENEIYLVSHDVKTTDNKVSKSFDFLAKKEQNGTSRGFSFSEEGMKYTRLNNCQEKGDRKIMIINHFCNSTFQGEYVFEDISQKGKVISNGSLFSIGDREYRVTNVLVRSGTEIVIETVRV